MRNFSIRRSILSAAVLAAVVLPQGIAWADPIANAITGGTVSLNLRPRYEYMSQAGKRDANAFTVQTLLGLASKPIAGFSANIQFIDVAGILNNYNSLVNGKTAYAVIPDPEEVNVNQAYLQYRGLAGLQVRAGRQEINLDDQRFVGAVGFRQTPQSFDAVSLQENPTAAFGTYAAYIWRIKNILNENLPSKTFLAETHWQPSSLLHAQAFGYWYGNQAKSAIPGAAACFLVGNAQVCNSQTLGLRFQGVVPIAEKLQIPYDASYAKQLPYDGGSSLINAQYYHLGSGLRWSGVGLLANYMVMGSNHNGSYGFQTPLATKHAFNGWAEVFLTTPKQGLRSLYFTLEGKLLDTALEATYYDFRSAYQSESYGHEVDLSAIHHFSRHWTAGVQYADYRSSHYGVNTEGAWVFVNAAF
ncbi:alginate export family protein [Acidithiobacillus sp. AMEEHan]|uniref:alginate export family protein n=1 Tax=Acidithiobacillus sp. AMEEHan TaxID=2994951 RepID=UPI0027E593B9|nr:alginate export family protein [Acidithiobacillus sp. AMEEHan]